MIDYLGGYFYINCKGSNFVDKKNFLKNSGGVFLRGKKSWIYPLWGINIVLRYCKKFNEKIEEIGKIRLLDLFDRLLLRLEDVERRIAECDIFEDYQKFGSLYLASKLCCFLCDDPGLGKTFQVLQAIPSPAVSDDLYAILILCPASILSVWENELSKWRTDLVNSYKINRINGTKNFRLPAHGEILICSLDSCRKLGSSNFIDRSILIVDEFHNLKSSKTDRYKTFKDFVTLFETKWCLSGTPITGSPMDLWNEFRLFGVEKLVFGTFIDFLKMFRGRKRRFGGYDFKAPKYFEVLDALRKVMLRRTRNIIGLKKGEFQFIDIELDEDTINKLNDLEDVYFGKSESTLINNFQDKLPDITLWSTVAKLVSSYKIAKMLEFISDYESIGEPIVVFSPHREPIDVLSKREGWKCIDGSTSKKKRGEYSRMFQEGKLKGIGITKAGMEGITLTNASTMLLVGLDYTPGKNQQVFDRINRIGQNRNCKYYILQVNHSIEHRLIDILLKKKEYTNPIVGNNIYPNNFSIESYKDWLVKYRGLIEKFSF